MKWLLWMSVLFFLSCGKSFEKEAEQHLDKIIEDTAIDPGSINLSDYEVIRSDDSIYLTSFTMEGKIIWACIVLVNLDIYICKKWTRKIFFVR